MKNTHTNAQIHRYVRYRYGKGSRNRVRTLTKGFLGYKEMFLGVFILFREIVYKIKGFQGDLCWVFNFDLTKP